MTNWSLSQKCKFSLTFENKVMYIHHITRIKEKNMIFSIDVKKSFEII